MPKIHVTEVFDPLGNTGTTEYRMTQKEFARLKAETELARANGQSLFMIGLALGITAGYLFGVWVVTGDVKMGSDL